MSSYSRYKSFLNKNEYTKIPFIPVPKSSSDRYTIYVVGSSRLDLISYQYYGDPNYGWLILQANPEVGGLEFKIEDRTRLRVPYPLDTAIQGYEGEIEKYRKLNGLD